MNSSPQRAKSDALASASRTFEIEIQGLQQVQQRLDNSFTEAIQTILTCAGRIVIAGLGKTGHIARKAAATFASTGTPAFFMHAAEALHGDLGMLTAEDVLIVISYSGTGAELISVLRVAKRLGAPVIAITGNADSPLAKNSDLHVNVAISQEACPLNLAPTASTTAALVVTDALAVACLEARGFSREDFALSHPGGALGRRLLTRVRDVMRQDQALPTINSQATIPQALAEMSAKGMGMTIVIDSDRRPIGIFTDGDLRRLIMRVGDIRTLGVTQGMTRNPRTISPDVMAIKAATLMDNKRINQILVVDDTGLLLGALHMHDLLAAKVI